MGKNRDLGNLVSGDGGGGSGSGVTVYTGLSGTDGTPANATYLLNASSPSAGDLAYVSSNTSLYQNNGNGWYRIAVINTTPTISSVLMHQAILARLIYKVVLILLLLLRRPMKTKVQI